MGRHLTVSEQWGYTAPLRWAARPAGQAPLSRHIPEQVRRAGHYGHTDTCTRSKGSACLTTVAKMFGFETAVARPAAWNWVYPGELFWAGAWGVGVPGPPGGSGLCFVQLSSPLGEIAPPNSPFRPSTAAPAAGLVYATGVHTSKVMPGVGGGARRSVLGVLSRLGVKKFGPSTSGGLSGRSLAPFGLWPPPTPRAPPRMALLGAIWSCRRAQMGSMLPLEHGWVLWTSHGRGVPLKTPWWCQMLRYRRGLDGIRSASRGVRTARHSAVAWVGFIRKPRQG